jgi:opacity protein-like surface antigen
MRMLLCVVAALPLHADWVVGAYLGGVSTENTSLYIDQPSLGTSVRFRDIQYRGRSFDSPLYYGARVAWFFHRRLGVEAELVHAKMYARMLQPVDASGTVGGERVSGRLQPALALDRFSISHGLNFLFANFVARHDFLRPPNREHGPVTVLARFGAGPTIAHPESGFRGLETGHYQWGRAGFQFAGGAELQVWRRVHVLVEYKYTRTNQRLRVAFGHAESLFRTHHGVIGLAYRF